MIISLLPASYTSHTLPEDKFFTLPQIETIFVGKEITVSKTEMAGFQNLFKTVLSMES